MPPPPPPPPAPVTKRPETGPATKEENIYIPSFISKRPFYAGDDEDDNDYLKHQRREQKKEKSQWYDRGKKAGPAATKFRKGACENCGAMTHKVKDCLSRPRAKGAKWTGKDIQADEVIQDVKLGWDAKRDRWNGYDTKEYRHVVEDFNQMEELRKRVQKSDDGGDEEEDGGDKYAEENDMSKHQSTATRQLRIREDTAKYLLNLDLESAKYDPKTRSLVDSGATKDTSADLFAEEGFLRSAGDADAFEKAQRYAWEAQERSGDTSQHLQANPTAGEFYRKKEAEQTEKLRAERERKLLEKYGSTDQKDMPAALRNMTVTESESFVEYDEAGLIKGAPRKKAKSKYAEDVLINNHTSVWGSWWSNFKWGYSCCHSFVKNSYCTGEEGKQAWEAAEKQRSGANLGEAPPAAEEEEKGDKEEEKKEENSAGDDDKDANGGASKKRTREEMLNGVSEAEMEEYRRKRTAANDPMAKFLGKDELIE
ncbi:pre-mRNA-processing factor SLU7 [Geosmithia morbida]|uniref:Pre-mRNA-splicing factor SLU7 n=1 Tax=Geosmithia morbida TaxID=1094350 RepID=A0A9P4YQH2_9HYPO|nr:pre-mRNA-processing factor SLU7 [Geosmithia morbida]KAF4119848.1 pre-mRNA-processing factor SLU7 [Geosmithia morbida]